VVHDTGPARQDPDENLYRPEYPYQRPSLANHLCVRPLLRNP